MPKTAADEVGDACPALNFRGRDGAHALAVRRTHLMRAQGHSEYQIQAPLGARLDLENVADEGAATKDANHLHFGNE